MSQRLFSVPKVPLFLDAYVPGTEKRRGETVKILTLTLRVQPFDVKHATSIDDGLNDESGVKTGLFKLTNGEPKKHLRKVDFNLACPRQNLHVFASSDTEASRIAFLQAKITGTYARVQKDVNGWAFVFKASIGPVGRDEQEYIHEWLLTQRAVTFEEAEPSIEFGEDDEDEDLDDDTEDDGALTFPGKYGATDEPEAFARDPEALKQLSIDLLGKQCFLDEPQLATLTDDERRSLSAWAKTTKKGPIVPPVLARAHHVAADKVHCAKCGQVIPPLHPESESPHTVNAWIGLDCEGGEEARPTARRHASTRDAAKAKQKAEGSKKAAKKGKRR